MAYQGFLKVAAMASADGKTQTRKITLVECEYKFHREVNELGIPKDGVTGGRIIATVITPQQSVFFYKWLFEERMENGFIEINNSDRDKHPHYIMFERARCVDIFEYFNNQSKNMMTTRLTLQCPEMAFFGPNNDSFAYDFRHQRSRPVSGTEFGSHATSDKDKLRENFDIFTLY